MRPGDDIQLIIQTQGLDGRFECEAFTGLPFTAPVTIVFGHVQSAESAIASRRLADAVIDELCTVAGGRSVPAPCGGHGDPGLCHTRALPDIQRLLVIVGDGQAPFDPASLPRLAGWPAADDRHAILPVLPLDAKRDFGALFPEPVSKSNACFWTERIEEAVPAVLAGARITVAPRIFISYRQRDSARVAIQLFDALSHDGFDVFLDHFRIPPGVDFQARLTQELGDKSMVLLLESTHLLESEWVRYEITEAKACGLGLFALNFGDAPAAIEVDEAQRMRLGRGDFAWRLYRGRLGSRALDRVRAQVRARHDRALLERRRQLEKSFEQAFAFAAGGDPGISVSRQSDGAYRVVGRTHDYLAWITTRPPDLPDFHYVHGIAEKPVIGVIIGLSRLMEAPRLARNAWLAGLCELKLVDEGRLVWAATEMARGAL